MSARRTQALREIVRKLPPIVRLNLVAMSGFNAGFSLVIPFLAVHMTDSLHLSAAVVALVLGARMAAQQGLFVFGGALSDRFGAKPMILLGVTIRIAGLILLGAAGDAVALTVGVVLVGGAAALFAPAVEATNAAYGKLLQDRGTLPRTELFAIEQVFSRIGTAIGPVIGTLLLPVPFIWTTLAAAVIFAGLLVAFAVLMPSQLPDALQQRQSIRMGLTRPLRDRAFLGIALVGSLYLAAQNLFYVLLPLHTDSDLVGYFYIASALIVILGQYPLRLLTRRLPPARLLIVGYVITAAAFAVPGLLLPVFSPTRLWPTAAVLATWIILLQIGQMMIMPATRDAVARIAGERSLGSYYGMFNTIGGFLALAVSWAVGTIIDLNHGTTIPAWLATAAFFTVTATVIVIGNRKRTVGTAVRRGDSFG